MGTLFETEKKIIYTYLASGNFSIQYWPPVGLLKVYLKRGSPFDEWN